MNDTTWYYIKDRQKVGPVSLGQLQDVLASGEVKPTDMVLQAGTSKWAPANSIQELIPPAIPLSTPSPCASTSSSSATRALAALKFTGTWLAHESREVFVSSGALFMRVIRCVKAIWQERTLQRAVVEAELALGRRLHETGHGDGEVRARITALDEQIQSLHAEKRFTRDLQQERKRLIRYLSASAPEQAKPGAAAEREHKNLKEAHDALGLQRDVARVARTALTPGTRTEWRRIGIGYAVALSVVVLGFVLLPTKGGGKGPRPSVESLGQIDDVAINDVVEVTQKTDVSMANQPTAAKAQAARDGDSLVRADDPETPSSTPVVAAAAANKFPISISQIKEELGLPAESVDSGLTFVSYKGRINVHILADTMDMRVEPGGMEMATKLFKSKLFTKVESKGIIELLKAKGEKQIGRFAVSAKESIVDGAILVKITSQPSDSKSIEEATQEDAKMEFLKELSPMVVKGVSLEELYKLHPDAKKGKLTRNPDGSEEVTWGDNLANHHAMLGVGKVLGYRWKVIRENKAAAEKEAAPVTEALGRPQNTTLPEEEPDVVSCKTWTYKGIFVRTAVVKGKTITGADVYFAEEFVVNSAALEKLLKKTEKPEPKLAGEDAYAALEKRSKKTEKPPEPKLVNSIGMKLVLIPAGEFLMGSPDSEAGRSKDEGPQHKVRITKSFYMGAFEVTQGQYEKVTGENPTLFKESPEHPVDKVTWQHAVNFCKKLSALPEEKRAGRVYRLPTSAEWEYACRAGTTTAFHTGASLSEANFGGDPDLGCKSRKVGFYNPNGWGLYDMHGNVREWCMDGPRKYPDDPKVVLDDPVGELPGFRILRGGDSISSAVKCRSASFQRAEPASPYNDDGQGFRVVCGYGSR